MLPFRRLDVDVTHIIASCMSIDDLVNAVAVSTSWRDYFTPLIVKKVKVVEPDPVYRELWLDQTRHLTVTGEPSVRAIGLVSDKASYTPSAWDNGWGHTRWVPHVFESDDLSLCAVSPQNGRTLCVTAHAPHIEKPSRAKTFEFDERLRPVPGTQSGGYTNYDLPDSAAFGWPSVIGLGPVMLRCVEGPDTEEFVNSKQVVEVWLSSEDRARFTSLDELAGVQRAEAEVADGFEYLASFPFRIDLTMGRYGRGERLNPPLDRLIAMHVDYDHDGALGISVAYSNKGETTVTRIADKTGRESTTKDNLVTVIDHGLVGRGLGYLRKGVVTTLLDNTHIFAADRSEIQVWSRATGAHLVTIDVRTLPNTGPAFDVRLENEDLGYEVEDMTDVINKWNVLPETIPNSTTRTWMMSMPPVLPGDEKYAELTAPDADYRIEEGSLLLAGTTLAFGTPGKVFIVPRYNTLFARVASEPEDKRADLVAQCTVQICHGYDHYALAGEGHHLLLLLEDTTYLFYLGMIPPLPPLSPESPWTSWEMCQYLGIGRQFDLGRAYAKRHLVTQSALYEVVSLTPDQELGYDACGWVEATLDFPKTIWWRRRWSDSVQGYPCAIRLISFHNHDLFKGKPPAYIIEGEEAAETDYASGYEDEFDEFDPEDEWGDTEPFYDDEGDFFDDDDGETFDPDAEYVNDWY